MLSFPVSFVFQGSSSKSDVSDFKRIKLSFGDLCLYFSNALHEVLAMQSTSCRGNNRLHYFHKTKTTCLVV